MQLAVYLAILLVTFVLMRFYGSPAKATPAPASARADALSIFDRRPVTR